MKKLMLTVAALVAVSAFADKVTLKSGSFLKGTAGGIQDGALKFKSDDLGDISIKIEQIADLDNAKKHVFKHKDGSVEERIVYIRNGKLMDGKGVIDMTDVKATDPVPDTWHGSVNVAFQADRGNSYGNTASVLANLNRRWEDDRVNFNFGYYYSKTGTSKHDWSKSKDKIELEGQYDHFWAEKVYNYINGRYDRDVIQGLDRRIKLGAGFGYQWLEKAGFDATGVWNFNQELGLAWVNDEYKVEDPDRKDNYATVRYAHHLTWEPKWTKGFNFFHDFEYLPEIDDFEIFLAKANVGFTTMLVWNIDLLAKIEWEFNSHPCGDRSKNDTRWIVGLGYKW